MSDKSIIGYTENLGLTLYRKGAKDWDSGYIAAMQKIDQEVINSRNANNITGIDGTLAENLTELYELVEEVPSNFTNFECDTLKINGKDRVENTFYGGTTAPSGTTRINLDGYFYATRVYNAVFNDVAEYFRKDPNSTAEAGDVLVMTENGIRPATKRGDKSAIGVFSDSFAIALKQEYQELGYPVGITGTVKVKVKEPLKISDVLVSDFDGYATKKRWYHSRSAIIGKVLETKTTREPERILILIGG